MGRRTSSITSSPSPHFARRDSTDLHQAVALQPLPPLSASSATTTNLSPGAVSASASPPAPPDPTTSAVPTSPIYIEGLHQDPVHRLPPSSPATDDPPFSRSIDPHNDPLSQRPTEAIALDPAHGPQPDDSAMASKTTPFLLQGQADRRDPPDYGAMALTPDRNASPAGSDSYAVNSLPLRRVTDTTRSDSSRRSVLSKKSSRLSEDIEGAVLVSGLEGRFGAAEASLHGGMLEDHMKDDQSSEDDPLLDDQDADSQLGLDDDDHHDDNSPHEAVRASVPSTDNTTLSVNTPRMWCLSVLFSILGSSTNLFFSLRYPSVAITPIIALLLVHPLGLLWDFLLKRPYDPDEEFVDGVLTPSVSGRADMPRSQKRFPSWRRWLAQGRWNEKEHTCVYVSSNVAFGFAFATDVIVEQTKFYNQEAPILYQLLLTISTQVLGYGFAGITREFLVKPSGMIWPGTLMSAAMFTTLHKQDNKPANGWTMSRWRFFYIVWIGAFVFYFLPGLLMPALSYFNVVTWFAPKNVVLANLFGVASGLGLFPLTFDWAQITYVGSPLLVPFWAAVNVVGGLAIIMWIIAPILYYSNFLFSAYMPILSAAVFDNTGNVYDVSRILTSDYVFDRVAYQKYSRVFLPVTYMLSYGMQFAGLAALLTHTLVWHGQDIWRTGKRAFADVRGKPQAVYQRVSSSPGNRPYQHQNMSGSFPNLDGLMGREDIHSRLMKRYKDAPLSWYLLTFASMAAIGIFIVEYYPVHLPWYGLLLALGIGALFFIPNGIIMAVTNQHSSIYLICQLVCGVVFPGRPMANMVFVTYGYISSAQGIKFASDLKLGHYMKIPPRILFTVQIVATLVSSVTQIGVLNWMFANVSGLCTPEAVNGFTCPIARVHFNGSILWGVVGPGEFFGPDALYRWLVWCFPLGALLPIPLWLYSRNKKKTLFRKINFPVIFGAMAWIPPATGLNFSVWALVCFIFNYVIKNRANAWWSKYTMTMSAALDSGLAFGIVVVFFGFIYPGLMDGFSWWGTEVYKQGCDWQACSYKTLGEGERFGPDIWKQ
ncbi:Glutathione transporter 1 [Paramyrothecium foliicola]|nr:Glutathione transporter 1 [Paramyrothecium foliicola]